MCRWGLQRCKWLAIGLQLNWLAIRLQLNQACSHDEGEPKDEDSAQGFKKLPNLLKAVTVVTTAIVVYTVSPGEVRGDAEPCLYRNRKKISHYLVR